MNKVVYVTKDNKETVNYNDAKSVGVKEIKYVPMIDEVAEVAKKNLIDFRRKHGGYALRP